MSLKSTDHMDSELSYQGMAKVNWIEEQKNDSHLNRVRYFVSRREKPSGKDLQQESDTVRSILREWKQLIIDRDVLYRETTVNGEQVRQLVLPSKYKPVVLSGLHDHLFHQGRDRTYWLVQQRF